MVVRRFDPKGIERRPGGVGQDPARGGMGECRLANALWAGEQPCMVKLARGPCRRESLDGPVLPDNHGNKSWMA
jgi:hypothetical protein